MFSGHVNNWPEISVNNRKMFNVQLLARVALASYSFKWIDTSMIPTYTTSNFKTEVLHVATYVQPY